MGVNAESARGSVTAPPRLPGAGTLCYRSWCLIPLSCPPLLAAEDVNVAFVTLREGEPPEAIVGRFRAAVTRNGILKEHKDRRFFRSKGEKARLAARRSARRRRRSGG